MNFKQVLHETRLCYSYNPPVDIEEKISEMDLNDHYFSSSNKNHAEREQRAEDTEDDELYSDSDEDDNESEKKTMADDDIQSENWNLVDVMTSFGSEGIMEENGGGESIFQLGASRIPGVMSMMQAKSQQSPIAQYLYGRR
ncbi:hypothetical protein K501DRAFT_95106 [Backusella circina FSU 941]|nr:hypothetical protein K501DRAFT_95106 [Backusella circina FSU 941]